MLSWPGSLGSSVSTGRSLWLQRPLWQDLRQVLMLPAGSSRRLPLLRLLRPRRQGLRWTWRHRWPGILCWPGSVVSSGSPARAVMAQWQGPMRRPSPSFRRGRLEPSVVCLTTTMERPLRLLLLVSLEAPLCGPRCSRNVSLGIACPRPLCRLLCLSWWPWMCPQVCADAGVRIGRWPLLHVHATIR